MGLFPFILLSLFAAACNPIACRAVGRGLQPKGVRVKETADFKVYTKGAGSGELKVTVKGPSKSNLCYFSDYLKVCRNLHLPPPLLTQKHYSNTWEEKYYNTASQGLTCVCRQMIYCTTHLANA